MPNIVNLPYIAIYRLTLPCYNRVVLSLVLTDMSGFIDAKDLQNEKEIVWLSEIKTLPYVRESRTDMNTRQGLSSTRKSEIESSVSGVEIVGYADLEDDAEPAFTSGGQKHFYRRIFTLRDSDRANDPEGEYKDTFPIEAVDPLTVRPKQLGVHPTHLKKSQISVRVPLPLLGKLERYIKQTGASKTDVVVSALAQYLDSAEDIPLSQKVIELEQKLFNIGKRLEALES
jgi:predicted DNA-binding protein